MIASFLGAIAGLAIFHPQAQPLEKLGPETLFYRGMDERQASLPKVLLMLANSSQSKAVIPSRRWSSLRSWNPALSDEEVSQWVDRDLAFFREKKLLGTYASCHSDWYECFLPTFEELLAASVPTFREQGALTSVALETIAQAEVDYRESPWKDRTLILFDPVISTSSSLEVATGFAEDRDPRFASYVLALNDAQDRHCSAATKKRRPSACFTTQTEYADELEYPFFGEIRAHEISGLSRNRTQVTRFSEGILSVATSDGVRFRVAGRGAVADCPAPPLESVDARVAGALRQSGLECLVSTEDER